MSEDKPEAKIVPLRRRGKPCPICGQPAQPAFRPFCSKYCANKDLLNWLRGDYRVETDEAPAEEGEERDL